MCGKGGLWASGNIRVEKREHWRKKNAYSTGEDLGNGNHIRRGPANAFQGYARRKKTLPLAGSSGLQIWLVAEEPEIVLHVLPSPPAGELVWTSSRQPRWAMGQLNLSVPLAASKLNWGGTVETEPTLPKTLNSWMLHQSPPTLPVWVTRTYRATL